MRFIKHLMLTALAFSFLFTFSTPVSYACSCAMPGPPTEEMARTDAVFSGKVIEIVDRNKNGFTQSSADPMEVVIAVDEIWKGIEESQVVVFTERDSASCGFEFAVNQEYIVYASKDGDQLKASLCSRTALLSLAADDLSELGAGEKPSIDVVIDTDRTGQSYWIYIGGIILIAAAVVVYLIRKRKI